MKNKEYVSPQVEVVTVVVEKGFQASTNESGGITAPGWGTI